MGLNRVKDFCRKTTHSKSKFYVLRNHPEDDPARIPEPDGYLNNGSTPVWTDETVDRYIAEQLERSKRERAAATRASTRRRSPATPAKVAA